MWDARHKFWCETCDFVCKARPGSNPLCPHCSRPGADVSMTHMGTIWKPGPKGDRMRHYPEGFRQYTIVHYPGGYRYERRVIGGHGYHRDQPAGPRWRPAGEKLRVRGRIRSWRLP
jgi:hypothetical protein